MEERRILTDEELDNVAGGINASGTITDYYRYDRAAQVAFPDRTVISANVGAVKNNLSACLEDYTSGDDKQIGWHKVGQNAQLKCDNEQKAPNCELYIDW